MMKTPSAAYAGCLLWDYTATRWNDDQAERYIQNIRDACRELAAGTRVSRPVDIRKGYRKVSVGSHFLYFKSNDTGQIVVSGASNVLTALRVFPLTPVESFGSRSASARITP